MKKTLLLTAFGILLTAIPVFAEYRSVTVRFNDNSTLSLNLNDELTVRFNDLEMTIQSPDLDKTVILRKENIAAFEHSTTASITEPGNDLSSPIFSDGSIHFSGLKSGSAIRVFDTSGRLLREAAASGEFSMPVSEFGSGTFVITVNNTTSFKIAIR